MKKKYYLKLAAIALMPALALIFSGCAKENTVAVETLGGVCPEAHSSKYYKSTAVPEKDYRFILGELVGDLGKLLPEKTAGLKKQIGPGVKIRHDSSRLLKKLLTSSGYQVQYVKLKKHEITEDLVWVDIFNLCGQYVGTLNLGINKAIVKTYLKTNGKLELQSISVAVADAEALVEE